MSHPAKFTLDVRPQLNNILFGFDLTGFVGRRGAQLPLHDLGVSVSPLPGGASGWNQLSASLRVNPATPFNGMGELYNYGWLVAMTYIFGAALILGEVRRQLARRIPSSHLAGLFITALTAILTVDLLQYNLRASTRILYYTVVLMAAVMALRRPLDFEPIEQAKGPGSGQRPSADPALVLVPEPRVYPELAGLLS